MRAPVSIVIITLNEEKYLPKLLTSLKNQSLPPAEIIVADAFSADRTRAIAAEFGAKVVDGGLPSKGRNMGAAAAGQELLLFLDADVVLPPKFLEETLAEIRQRNLDIASCYTQPITQVKLDKFLHDLVNYYLRYTAPINTRMPGYCIFVKKWIHQAISGFDETMILCEDHDYLSRAKKFGKFAFLRSYKVPVSVRRLRKEGLPKLALKYLATELHLIFLGKITKPFFAYEFGKHK